METKERYVRTMQAKLDEWSAEVDELSTRASQVTAGLRTEYGAQIDVLQAKQEVARQKLEELQRSSSDAWKDLKGGIESAWKAIGEALDSARSRY